MSRLFPFQWYIWFLLSILINFNWLDYFKLIKYTYLREMSMVKFDKFWYRFDTDFNYKFWTSKYWMFNVPINHPKIKHPKWQIKCFLSNWMWKKQKFFLHQLSLECILKYASSKTYCCWKKITLTKGTCLKQRISEGG